ncbi:hypothetical protein GQ43DRAFT_442204 [Delitschia confertaspora ATCC 74209]|uniref:Uncharacterized protein n=1 Tax=Delitschia confertaspora ATCC 74209 TaxID=1513339 RepID=A0A9P4MU53_9PLEO|nr:hypothetical protein GQ43DRAFT_442204 [Delitschia confertaspora ATCC 74209]
MALMLLFSQFPSLGVWEGELPRCCRAPSPRVKEFRMTESMSDKNKQRNTAWPNPHTRGVRAVITLAESITKTMQDPVTHILSIRQPLLEPHDSRRYPLPFPVLYRPAEEDRLLVHYTCSWQFILDSVSLLWSGMARRTSVL